MTTRRSHKDDDRVAVDRRSDDRQLRQKLLQIKDKQTPYDVKLLGPTPNP